MCNVVFVLTTLGCSANTGGILSFATAAILRLGLFPGPPVSSLVVLLNRATECLKRMEMTVTIPSSLTRLSSITSCEPLFRAYEIHEPYPQHEPLQAWGQCVESLWCATMSMETKPYAWDMLSSRLLLWRAIVGPEASPIGEWARAQVVCNLLSR